MPRKFFIFGFLVAFILGMASTALAGNSLMVDLRSDYRPGDEFTAVRTILPSGSQTLAIFTTDVVDPSLRVADFPDVAAGTYDVTVELLRADESVLASRRIILTMPNAPFILTAVIARTGDATPTCEEQLAEAQAALAASRPSTVSPWVYRNLWRPSRLIGFIAPDADGDRVNDASDRCASTPAGNPVDTSGCSNRQYCAGFVTTTAADRRRCEDADWRADEASSGHPRDCVVRSGACVSTE